MKIKFADAILPLVFASVMATLAATAVGIFLGFVEVRERTDEFKQACEATGGKPLYNGRNWECFQPKGK